MNASFHNVSEVTIKARRTDKHADGTTIKWVCLKIQDEDGLHQITLYPKDQDDVVWFDLATMTNATMTKY